MQGRAKIVNSRDAMLGASRRPVLAPLGCSEAAWLLAHTASVPVTSEAAWDSQHCSCQVTSEAAWDTSAPDGSALDCCLCEVTLKAALHAGVLIGCL